LLLAFLVAMDDEELSPIVLSPELWSPPMLLAWAEDESLPTSAVIALKALNTAGQDLCADVGRSALTAMLDASVAIHVLARWDHFRGMTRHLRAASDLKLSNHDRAQLEALNDTSLAELQLRLNAQEQPSFARMTTTASSAAAVQQPIARAEVIPCADVTSEPDLNADPAKTAQHLTNFFAATMQLLPDADENSAGSSSGDDDDAAVMAGETHIPINGTRRADLQRGDDDEFDDAFRAHERQVKYIA
jgi:uncharacterized protein YcbX